MEEQDYCCEGFKHIVPHLHWDSYTDDDGNEKYVMACLGGYHVNYCPSCGKGIRGVTLSYNP